MPIHRGLPALGANRPHLTPYPTPSHTLPSTHARPAACRQRSSGTSSKGLAAGQQPLAKGEHKILGRA